MLSIICVTPRLVSFDLKFEPMNLTDETFQLLNFSGIILIASLPHSDSKNHIISVSSIQHLNGPILSNVK